MVVMFGDVWWCLVVFGGVAIGSWTMSRRRMRGDGRGSMLQLQLLPAQEQKPLSRPLLANLHHHDQ